jgi:hypothetical protein
MSDLDLAPDNAGIVHEQEDEAELAAAYEALAEDRRQQAELAAAQASIPMTPVDSPPATEPVADGVPAEDTTSGVSEVPAQAVEPMPGVSRRVFLIDGKEYPDPDSSLPITGARSVQAMYRDYFPGQLDNADVVQKTRPDGTLEITFKRRIGTKGVGRRVSHHTGANNSGEAVITVARVAGVLAGLHDDRPLAWELVEQAIAPDGTVRLDYVPPASQLNLAEAQQTARTRLIDLAVSELARLRPCA